jgi:hypothetical protein
MPQNPPYLVAPGSIRKCFDQIKKASTPERVTQDFVQTKLGIKGGTGAALIPFLKKIGFVNSDGTPSELYKRFRNPTESSAAVAAAIRRAYASLYGMNEYLHDLPDAELKGLLVQATGLAEESPVVALTLRTFKNLKEYADFNAQLHDAKQRVGQPEQNLQAHRPATGVQPSGLPLGTNLSYTINLNLPAVGDIAVFNAIFRSLKENLLQNAEQ